MKWIVLGLVTVIAIFLGRRAARRMGVRASAPLLPVDDARLVAARRRAREECGQFLERVKEHDRPCFVALHNEELPEPHLEWARVIHLTDQQLQLEFVDDERSGEALVEDLVDWQVEEGDGRIRGGYCVRVVLDHLIAQPGSSKKVVEQRARYLG